MTEQTIKDIDKAFKALEERDELLDKIRAEIEAHPKTYPFVNHINAYIKASDCLKIIDKYKEDSKGDTQ
jgi:acyl-[acyl carrier protein]--UDP-N-acetylglucosamine O-acyltransferase